MEQSGFNDKEPKQVFIDNAVPADAEEIVNLMKDTWLEVYPSPENGVTSDWLNKISQSFKPEYVVKKLEENSDSPNHLFILARNQNGEMLGFLQGIKKPDYNELRSIYLDVDDIGHGTGGKLMEQFLDWIDPNNPTQLEVVTYNERAIGFYEHYGFEKTDKQIEKFLGVMPQTRMVRYK